MLEVEHIQPKALPRYQHLIGTWTNFLLACRNCNATKGHKDVVLAECMLPDRDNTFLAFTYLADGKLAIAPSLSPACRMGAEATLKLTGVNKPLDSTVDQNGKLVALDRRTQRMEAWSLAELARDDIQNDPGNLPLQRMAIRLARETGFFSIWMAVFEGDSGMRVRLIDAFPGTRASGCFSIHSPDPVTPAPNPDGLAGGGKL